jgi:hypothetical protein
MVHKILRFTEVTYLTDYETGIEEEYSRHVQEVSTRRIEKFEDAYGSEYGYIDHLVKDALEDKLVQRTSSKYSFGDCEDWYLPLKPYRDCTDPVVEITVNIWK